MDLLQALPDTVRFMPHGHCFFWRPEILWLHVASDAVIALAYYSIPLTLLVFLRRRSHTRFAGVVLMFSAFIFACGTTHLFSIATMWNPLYRAEGLVKLVTAGVSLTTAVALWPILPRMLDLPDPAELAEANDALRREVAVREAAEEKLRQSNEELQHRLVELDSAQRELRGLLEATPDAMLIVDAEGRIESANREVSRLFGYESDELSGRSVEDLVPERFHETHPELRSRFV
jgi:PAS domain-containing protein